MDTFHEIIEQLRSKMDELAERVRVLQDDEDKQFRSRVRSVAPLPLETVYWFSLGLEQKFWADILKLTPEEMEYAKKHGKVLDRVRIKSWRSHKEVAIFEKEFDAQEVFSSPLDPRTLHPRPAYEVEMYGIHPSEDFGRNTLWRLPLGPPEGPVLPFSPVLCLDLYEWRVELCATYGRFGMVPAADVEPKEEYIFLSVPLDLTRLDAFKVPDDPEDEYDDPWLTYKAEPWDLRYAHEDQHRGIHWGLSVLDLQRYGEEVDI